MPEISWVVPLKITVDEAGTNVPELVQSPPKVIFFVFESKVPEELIKAPPLNSVRSLVDSCNMPRPEWVRL